MPCSMAWGKWILILELRCVNHFHVLPSMWKNPPYHHLWDVPVAHTAQIGNSHLWRLSITLLLQTSELSFWCLTGYCCSRLFSCNYEGLNYSFSLNECWYILQSFITSLVYGRMRIKTNLPYLLHKYSVSSSNWFGCYIVLVHIMLLPSFLCEH